jgi:hypothetical protein
MAFPNVAHRGSQRLDDKEPKAQKGKVTCLKFYFKLITRPGYLGIMPKIRNSGRSV